MDSNEDFYRRYLDDPTTVQPGGTPMAAPAPTSVDENLVEYLRRYLDDPDA